MGGDRVHRAPGPPGRSESVTARARRASGLGHDVLSSAPLHGRHALRGLEGRHLLEIAQGTAAGLYEVDMI